jgi:MFS family permease
MSGSAVAADRAALPSRDANLATRWWILGVVGLAQLMVVLDATIVNIALPSAQRALGFSNADRQWIVTAYSLAFGGLLLVGGRLSDLVGRRRMFLIGLVGFAAASALGGYRRALGRWWLRAAHRERSARCSPRPLCRF